MRRTLLTLPVLFAALAAGTTAAAAQSAPAPADTTDGLAVFDRLLGEWEGPAWAIRGPGGRHEVFQREWVERHAGGTVIAVKGVGTEQVGDEARVVHDAFAVIHLDRDGRTPRMRAFTPGGRWLDVELTVRPDGYDWGFADPRAGLVRYEVRFDEQGRWVERGFISRDDGASWQPFMEMTLTRVR